MRSVTNVNDGWNHVHPKVFCPVMLCISAAYAVMRYLSVRLSVTFVYSVEATKASKHQAWTSFLSVDCRV